LLSSSHIASSSHSRVFVSSSCSRALSILVHSCSR